MLNGAEVMGTDGYLMKIVSTLNDSHQILTVEHLN